MWANNYIGIKYKENGRTLDGLDCWGLVRQVYKDQYKIELPSFDSSYNSSDTDRVTELLAQYREGWNTTDNPEEGSVVLFRVMGQECHVGVAVSNTHFLHIREGLDSVIESFDNPKWKKRIAGFFKYSENAVVTLNAVPHPLKTNRITAAIPIGTNLEEIYNWLTKENNPGEVPETVHILMNGIVVPRDQWGTTLVRDGDSVEYRSIVRGRQALRTVLLIAVVLVAPELAQMAGNAAFASSGGVAAGTAATATAAAAYYATYAATLLAGTYLINAIAPIRLPGPGEDPGEAERQYLTSGGRNEQNLYGAIPVVLGKVRMTPPLGAQVYSNFGASTQDTGVTLSGETGKNNFLNLILTWGYGPLFIDSNTLRIGQTPLTSYQSQDGTGYQIQTLDRITDPTQEELDKFFNIYGQDVQQVYRGIELTNKDAQSVDRQPPPFNTTGFQDTGGNTYTDDVAEPTEDIFGNSTNPEWTPDTNVGNWISSTIPLNGSSGFDKVVIALNFPQGLRSIKVNGSDSGKSFASPVKFGLEYRNVGSSTWNSWGTITIGGELYPNGSIKNGTPKKDAFTYGIVKERVVGGVSQWSTTTGLEIRIRRETGSATESTDGNYRYYHQAVLYTLTGYTSGNIVAGNFITGNKYVITSIGTTNFTTIGASSNTIGITFTATGPGTGTGTAILESSLPTIDPPNSKIAKTAISVRATDQINGQLEGINAVVQTRCLIWNGTTWVLGNTSNPAALFRYVLTHPGNPQRVLDSELSERIDLTQIQYWYDYCVSKGFEYNAVVGAQKSVLEVLRDICAAGRASPAFINGKWTVVIDEPKSNIVQHFTPHNSWGFESTKAIPKYPHALKVQFYDETNDYQVKEVIVPATGYTADTAELFETISLPGVTKESLVVDHARWHFAQAKLRPEVYTINTDVEYLVCNRGDRVKVTHDVPMWGTGSGRIKNRLINGIITNTTNPSSVLELDEPVTIDVTKTYNIRVRGVNNTSTVKTVKTSFFIVSYSYSGTTVTINLDNSNHPLQVGNTITVTAATAINGSVIITSVNGATITYTKTGLTGSLGTTAVTGTAALTSGIYNTIQTVSTFTFAECAPLDLFLFGELNTESQDLLVLSIEPTGGAKSARLTLVDYGVTSTYNIFTGYQNLTGTTFSPNITRKSELLEESFGTKEPSIISGGIKSDESVIEVLSPGVYRYKIRVPYVNDVDLPPATEYVQGEIDYRYRTDNLGSKYFSSEFATGSIDFSGVEEGENYRIRLRYVSKSGRVGQWTSWVYHQVVGKTTPPSSVSGLSNSGKELGVEISWNSSQDPDYKLTELRYAEITEIVQNPTWNDSILLFRGPTNKWTWTDPASGSWRIFAKHVDVLDNYSTSAAQTNLVDWISSSVSSILVELSNPGLIPSDTDGTNPILTNSGTTITVYQGNTVLKYDGIGAANGRWKINTKTDGAGITSGAIAAVQDSTNGDSAATIGNLTTFTTDTAIVTYTIIGKTTAGKAFSITKIQRYTKAKTGKSAAFVTITPGTSSFSKDTSGNINPTSVVLTANAQNITSPSFQWTRNGVNIGTNSSTYTVSNVDFNSVASNVYAITVTGTVNGAANQTVNASTTIVRVDSGVKGDTGNPGDKYVTLTAFRWLNTGIPSSSSYAKDAVYSWDSKSVNVLPDNWSPSAPNSPGSGYTLYVLTAVVSASGTATITPFNWNTASVGIFGFRQDGNPGTDGQSYRIAYTVTNSSNAPGTVTAGTGNVPPTSPGTWSFTATSNLSAGQYMYQVDGTFNPVTGNITWGNPYLSNLKVGSLSALAVDTGNLTFNDTGSIRNSGNLGFAQPGIFLGYDTSAYKFSIGDLTNYLRWNGSTLTIIGSIVTGSSISNAVTLSSGTALSTVETNAAAGLSASQALPNKLDKQTTYILGTTSASNQITLKTSGFDGGNGIAITDTGIVGKKSGATTFALDNNGDASFKGTITAGSVITNSVTLSSGTALSTVETNAAAGLSASQALPNKLEAGSNYTLSGVVDVQNTGGIRAGSVTWNSATGAVTGGTGVVFTENGIIGALNGNVKFSITNAGDATFAGTLSSPTGSLGNLGVAGLLTGGSYTGVSWPASGGNGFVLYSGGLLMGSTQNSNGGYFEYYTGPGGYFALGFGGVQKLRLDSDGLVIDGKGTFSGSLSAASGTFTGSLSAASGTFKGSVNIGDYTGFAWPTGSGTGAHLGPSGLLLGNYESNAPFVQIATSGYIFIGKNKVSSLIYDPTDGTYGKLTINGSGTFGGTITASAGTFGGIEIYNTGTETGIRSTNYSATNGFAITSGGFAVFRNASIAGVNISSTQIYSNDYNATTGAGFAIANNGFAEFYNVKVKGEIAAGGLSVGNVGNVRGGQTDYATGTGFFLGYSGGAHKFSIGDANKFLKWDGSTLTVTGPVISGGSIGSTTSITLPAFSASIPGGNYDSSGGVGGRSNSRSVTATGGTGTYSYRWAVSYVGTEAGITNGLVTLGATTAQSVTVFVSAQAVSPGDPKFINAEVVCYVTDSNNRTATTSFAVSAQFNP